MINLDEYDPKCPECSWKIDEDVFYQVYNEEAKHLSVGKDLKPIAEYSELPIYPQMIGKELHWEETHCCPKCKKEYVIQVPKF